MNKEPPRLRLVTVGEVEEALERRRRGFWLRVARENAGLTQAAAAELIGYRGTSKSSVNAWEDGRRPVPLAKLKALAKLYGVPMELFIDPQPTAHERVERLQVLAAAALDQEAEDWEAGEDQGPAADDGHGGPPRRRSA